MLKHVFRTAWIASILCMIFVVEALAVSVPCIINTDTKVYAKASTSAAATPISKNTSVKMTAFNGTWARIVKNGVTAYLPLKYLTLTEPLTYYVKSKATLYTKASTSSTKLCSLSAGTKVYVFNRTGDFFFVTNASRTAGGFLKAGTVTTHASNVNPKPDYSESMVESDKIEAVCDLAQSLLNRPYKSDANPPSSFDCSRFVRYCFLSVGVALKATAKDQGYDKTYTKIENISDLVRGDVVCFNTNLADSDLSDHTGIYLGNYYFIHASSSAGKVIRSRLDEGYYKTAFSWGRRVFE